MALPENFDLAEFVQRVLAEDLGKGGDVTSASTIAEEARFSAEMNARQEMVVAGVDILLAGHNHHASSQDASDLVTRAGGVLVVQAGTATSTRVRDEDQSFNTIDVSEQSAAVTVNAWNGDEFVPSDAKRYQWQDGKWKVGKSVEPAA